MHFTLTFLVRYNKAFFIHGNAKHGPEGKENEASVNTGVFLGISVAKGVLESTAQKKRPRASVLVIQYVVQWVPERKRAKGIFEAKIFLVLLLHYYRR
jgi:hypothetical protein